MNTKVPDHNQSTQHADGTKGQRWEFAQVRVTVGDMPLLVPGIGAQGGDIKATVEAGQTADGTGMMINSSRAILYAKPEAGEDFAAAAARVARETRDAVNQYRRGRQV
jgi:orotidine-5'-phosphate decarboxylase